MAYRWVDVAWWRDWVFWVAAAVATSNLVLTLRAGDVAWWWYPLTWGFSFAVVVGVLGFGRTVVRTYRAPSSPDD